ncbi:ribonuclease R [Marinimicrobium agarilyticum]|uniref:ribonuclease R n=1 Tax=Marinimicrobium agarilyticum TaxID=306546 RepID=UPI00041AD5DB|nr:ribonuclease R [Marinimicrobium agarilyticum]
MSKEKHPKQDPHAEREAQKYDNPVPSREFILELLDSAQGPVTHPEVCDMLNIQDEDQVEAVRRRLIAMARDGQLVSNRRGAFARLDKIDVIRGRVQGHRDGYGFVIPAKGGNDLYLHNRQMRRVFDGDEVLVRVTGSYRGKDEAAIVEILARNTQQIAGRFFREDGVQFVSPENARITQDVMIPPGAEGKAEPGQIVVVEITQQPEKKRPPTGRVIQVLGDHMAPGMEIELAIQSHGIPNIWPESVTEEAKTLSDSVREEDKLNRIDLRDRPFVTIDGADARDFDDAVLCEKRRGGGWRLFVAIADVSHYVPCNSALDTEARKRGNSVYFPDYVVPMLPEALSNGLCSLNPSVDRLCMVCEMTLSADGTITGYKFFEGVMHSHARLTYNQVWEILEAEGDDQHPLRKEFSEVLPQLHNLHKLYKVLRQARDERGAIDFETTETQIVFNEDRKIDRIVPVKRNDAHKLIEECMLCANVCTARFLEKHNLTCLYRVHQGPTEEKLANLREFLGELGLGLGGGSEPTSADFQALMQQIQDRSDSHLIQMVMLRTLKQAVYQVENQGHFGLGFDAYTHFTSPIRRYPDLLVHRAIRSVIRSERPSSHVARVEGAKPLAVKDIYPYETGDVVALGEHCSMTERRADDATRDVVSWLKCEYLQDHVGEVFDGVVASAVGFGLFVELKDLYVEGLVHITALPHDYYRFDPAQHRLVGDRTRKVFGLGDELRVRVVQVDLDSRKIDFELESVTATRRGKGKANAKPPAETKAQGKGKAKTQGKNQENAQGTKGSGKPGQGRKGRGRGRGRRDQQEAPSKRYDQTQGSNTSESTKAGAVRSEKKDVAPAGRSLFATAAAGVKKALAKFKKKR